VPRSIASLSRGRAGRLPLIGGRLCLDFVNTSSGRGTPTHQDHLGAYNDLLAWSHHAGAMEAKTALALAGLAGRNPVAARHVLARSVKLRGALFAILTALARGLPPPAAALASLNESLARSHQAARLEPKDGGFSWAWPMRPPRLDLPLWMIARSAAEMLTDGPLDRLKTCAGEACGWVFLDATRNGRRRWCEMEVCGSRAKMRRFRRRLAA